MNKSNTKFTDIAWCPLVTRSPAECETGVAPIVMKTTQAARYIPSIARSYKDINLKALLIAVEESVTQPELLDLATAKNSLQCLEWPIFIISLEYKKVLQYIKDGRSVKVQLTASSGDYAYRFV